MSRFTGQGPTYSLMPATWFPAMALLLLLAPVAFASDPASVLFDRGQQLVDAGHCDRAVPVLDAALEYAPDRAEIATLAGRCLLTLKQPEEALKRFRRATSISGGDASLQLYLAAAHYHAGEFDEASEALEQVPEAERSGAEYELYAGLLAIERDEFAEAARSLTRARSDGTTAAEPMASYYESIARTRLDDSELAERALERVADFDGNGRWGRRARRELRRSTGGSGWYQLTVGYERDSNVLLEGGDPRFQAASGNHDQRLVWGLSGGAEIFRNRNTAAGVTLRYSGNAHDDEQEFNAHYPSLGLWFDRQLGEGVTAQLQYDLGQAWIDGDPFMLSHTATPSLAIAWDGGVSTLFTRAYWTDFRFDASPMMGISARELERDGRGLATGISHALPVAALSKPLQFGYAFHLFEAEGDEYDFRAHELNASTGYRLPAAIELSLEGSYSYQPYDHTSGFAQSGGSRRDVISRYAVGLAREIAPATVVSAQYRFTDYSSNVDVYDYDRSILGLYLSYTGR